MTRWTNGAEELWQQFRNEARKRLNQSDIDADEVLDDLQRHIETELNAQKLEVVTAEDMKKVLNRLELPQANTPKAPVPASPAASSPVIEKQKLPYHAMLSSLGGFYIIVFGVLLPVAAATFELLTRLCSTVFFDPLPTIWHVGLFLMIPVFNLGGYCAVKYGTKDSIRKVGFLNGIAIGNALFYTLWFLPILPFSGIAVTFMGLGLCGLAPLLSFIACLIVRKRLHLLAAAQNLRKVPLFWPGFGCGFGILLLLIVPALFSVIGLNMAVSVQPAVQNRGLWLLRNFSSKRYLLERCYNTRNVKPFGIDITGTADISSEKIRGIYYRVTGKSFNTERPRTSFLHRGNAWIDDWDFEQAGDVVGGQLRNLSLVSSQMDANLQADGAVGYLEWIMVFQNDHLWTEREARCQVQLPPGGVVSRLTLWIDGQECEAAFGGREQTKGAYKSVVQRRRDPVLVTTKGPDQVLVQCFPVPSNSGKMKVRLGISFPLDLVSSEEALLQLPYINERNFQMPPTTEHRLWIEADGPLSAKLGLTAESTEGKYAIRGAVTNAQLEQQAASVRVTRNPQVSSVWAKREFDNETVAVLQQLHNNKGRALIEKAVVVVDTSKSMASHITDIANVITTLNVDFNIDIVAANDTLKTTAFADKNELKKLFHKSNFKGGKDNLPALVHAWDIASQSANAAVIWIHSAQPHIFDEVDPLVQRWNRRPDGPKLIHIQTSPGPNVVIESLDGIQQVDVFSRSASLKDDLGRLFGQLNGTVPTYKFVRQEILPTQIDTSMKQASSHIVRLWANEKVQTMRAKRSNAGQSEAKAIAVKHQLVTPVSGAVVLENAEQYDQHDLRPVDPETVPTIPEPATIMLLGVGGLIAVHFRKKTHRQ
ncbi:MAG: PEP-CTERM sorting domain-containing protein [Planctomycetales bacterium]|nr:PEP-CTERM sorting domain-containing protein [Planctomycetales bacterium]